MTVPLNVMHYDRGDGVEVAGQTHLRGRDGEHTLCGGCSRFRPGSPHHCHIASAVHQLRQAFAITTPVWECAEFVAGKP